MRGAPLRTVQELLGHKTLAMVQRYSHLFASHLHEAVSRIQIAVGNAAATGTSSDAAPSA